MKDALTILKDAYTLLQDKNNWTSRVAARTASGSATSPVKQDAARFCAAGAIWGVSGLTDLHYGPTPQREAVSVAFNALGQALGKDTSAISDTNDGENGYELILAGYRKAIAGLTPIERRPAKEAPAVEEKIIVIV